MENKVQVLINKALQSNSEAESIACFLMAKKQKGSFVENNNASSEYNKMLKTVIYWKDVYSEQKQSNTKLTHTLNIYLSIISLLIVINAILFGVVINGFM